jgi:hypothetical protein
MRRAFFYFPDNGGWFSLPRTPTLFKKSGVFLKQGLHHAGDYLPIQGSEPFIPQEQSKVAFL